MPKTKQDPRPDKYVRLDKDLHTELKAKCAMRGCTMQALVTKLIRRELEKKS